MHKLKSIQAMLFIVFLFNIIVNCQNYQQNGNLAQNDNYLLKSKYGTDNQKQSYLDHSSRQPQQNQYPYNSPNAHGTNVKYFLVSFI